MVPTGGLPIDLWILLLYKGEATAPVQCAKCGTEQLLVDVFHVWVFALVPAGVGTHNPIQALAHTSSQVSHQRVNGTAAGQRPDSPTSENAITSEEGPEAIPQDLQALPWISTAVFESPQSGPAAPFPAKSSMVEHLPKTPTMPRTPPTC